MSRTYRKEDVELHSDGFGRSARPAVNVKVYGSVRNVELPLELGRVSNDGGKTFEAVTTDPRFDRDWIEDNVTDSDWEHLWEYALEQGWEWLQTLAEDTFGYGVKVYSEGRSGGWAVIDGLPDIEDWNAIALTKWRRFERDAKLTASAIPRDMLDMAYANLFEPWADEEAKKLTGPTFEAVR